MMFFCHFQLLDGYDGLWLYPGGTCVHFNVPQSALPLQYSACRSAEAQGTGKFAKQLWSLTYRNSSVSVSTLYWIGKWRRIELLLNLEFFIYSLCFFAFFRATLLLVPLLGLQYIVTPFHPDPGHPLEYTYEVISAFTASFQVSILRNDGGICPCLIHFKISLIKKINKYLLLEFLVGIFEYTTYAYLFHTQ